MRVTGRRRIGRNDVGLLIAFLFTVLSIVFVAPRLYRRAMRRNGHKVRNILQVTALEELPKCMRQHSWTVHCLNLLVGLHGTLSTVRFVCSTW